MRVVNGPYVLCTEETPAAQNHSGRHRAASTEFESEIGAIAGDTEEGVRRGAAHVEDAGAAPSATR